MGNWNIGKGVTPYHHWLQEYVRRYVLDRLSPTERSGFRLAAGNGEDAVERWVHVTLPRYPTLWRRLQAAIRQRRHRERQRSHRDRADWRSDWAEAERVLGAALTGRMRSHAAAHLGGPEATPMEIVEAAVTLLEERRDRAHRPAAVAAAAPRAKAYPAVSGKAG